MSYVLYLDDVRFPDATIVTDSFVALARSSPDAIALVKLNGMPKIISFDHDLGGEDSSVIFLRWLIETFPNGPIPDYRIHSMNPIGSKNIDSLMKSWQKSLVL